MQGRAFEGARASARHTVSLEYLFVFIFITYIYMYIYDMILHFCIYIFLHSLTILLYRYVVESLLK